MKQVFYKNLPQDKDLSRKAKEYWNEHMEEFKIESSWTSNQIIANTVCEKMTNNSGKFWLNWTIEDYLSNANIKKVLSICCGSGDHEIIIGKLKKEWHIDAFDISDESIRVAKQKAQKNSVSNINFFTSDVNNLNIKYLKNSYDLILSSGALHHVKELENLFWILQQKINSTGYFVINEFCGPSRHQWTDKQIEISNKLLKAIDPKLRIEKTKEVLRPTIENMIKHDPSESIRSSDIYPLLDNYFKIEYKSAFGGTILHILYPVLNHAIFKNKSIENNSIINLLITIEDILIKNDIINSDFNFFIARKK